MVVLVVILLLGVAVGEALVVTLVLAALAVMEPVRHSRVALAVMALVAVVAVDLHIQLLIAAITKEKAVVAAA